MGNLLFRSTGAAAAAKDDFQLTRENVEHKNIIVYGKNGKGKSTLIKNFLEHLPFKCGHIVHDHEGFNPVYTDLKGKKEIYNKIGDQIVSELLLDSVRYADQFKFFVVDTKTAAKTSKSNQGSLQKIISERLYTLLIAVDNISQITDMTRSYIDLLFIFKESNAAYLHPIWEHYLKESGILEEDFRIRVANLKDDNGCMVINCSTNELLSFPSF